MIKKFICIMITLFMCGISFMPAFSVEESGKEKKLVIKTKLISDVDINKSYENQEIKFQSIESFKVNNTFFPSHAVFTGRLTSVQKSHFAFKRAKADVILKELILPNGETVPINSMSKNAKLRGSLLGNIGKSAVGIPAAVVVGVAGGAAMVGEAVSIIGLSVLEPTKDAVGNTINNLTSGVNCKKSKDTVIPLTLKVYQYAPVKDKAAKKKESLTINKQ